MQIVGKCPSCGKPTLVKMGSSPMSEMITNERKKCASCGKELEIDIRIVIKALEPSKK